MIVILSRTKYAKGKIFVGNKDYTLKSLKELLTRKTQWIDYMEKVLSMITMNSTTEYQNQNHPMNQNTFPFIICDFPLPQYNTGYVYMLMSIRDPYFTYIGATFCIRTITQRHNSGDGLSYTEPVHLLPYDIMLYVCGFDQIIDLMFYVEPV